ncbi:DUF4296 domain-containing protein [Cytophaga aurantiaca]|uniref:DUF4296 domain-containing protein n=1 Tax=Cytophaga aurantiaca TaxID=29530 RepID=UPI0012FBB500|nr:DUF4296 domain-containing protein [Cytophaga aurantiaca]
MNYFKLIILLGFTVLFSCSSETELDVKPDDLISEEKMIDVLIDVHITESALSLQNFNRDSSMKLFAYYKEDLFKEHKITEKQFQNSYDYYAKHSKEFDHMYEIVIDSLKVKEATGSLK